MRRRRALTTFAESSGSRTTRSTSRSGDLSLGANVARLPLYPSERAKRTPSRRSQRPQSFPATTCRLRETSVLAPPRLHPLATTCRRLVTACHEGRRRSRLPPPIPLFPLPLPHLHPQLLQLILLIRTRGPTFPVSFLLFLLQHPRLRPSSTPKKHN